MERSLFDSRRFAMFSTQTRRLTKCLTYVHNDDNVSCGAWSVTSTGTWPDELRHEVRPENWRTNSEERLMGTKSQLAIALGAVAFGAMGSAHATTLSIGASLDGSAITTEASGLGPSQLASFSIGSYNVNTASGVDTNPSQAELDSNAIDATTNGSSAVLHVFVTEQGLTGLSAAQAFLSSFTSNSLASGWTVTESTFYSDSNALFGGTLLSSTPFSLAGTSSATAVASLTSPFSITEEFTVASNMTAGQANDTIDMAALPEASTLAIMVVGFAGLGYAGFRGRKTSISIV